MLPTFGRNIIGLKLGHAVGIWDKREPTLNWGRIVKLFWWTMNRDTARSMHLFDAMYNDMRYDPHMAMEDTGTTKVFVGDILSVSRSHRGMKLGTALTLRSMELARAKCCDCYFAILTSNYSQRIYRELGFTWLKECAYASIKDRNGKEVLSDVGEHKSMICAYKRLP